jgi:uncharacterized protein (TIGR03437 family)
VMGQDFATADPVSTQPGSTGLYPFQINGTQVTFDGIAAPLFYISAVQINAVTPAALAGKTITHVCVLVKGAQTNCVDAPVQPASPGIFLKDGHAAALNQDGSLNSQINPAAPGSIVALFATGLGTSTPAIPDGGLVPVPVPVPDLAISVLVPMAGIDQTPFPLLTSGNVFYAGPAPQEIVGLSQINFQVPAISGGVYISANSASFSSTSVTSVLIWTTGQQ